VKEVEEKVVDLKTRQETESKKLQKARKSKKDIANFYKDIDDAKSRIERVALEIEKNQQLLPSEISDTENINLLKKMADDVNIKELSITPMADENREFYIARKYKLKAKATFLQFLIMFEKISEYKRILNVSDLLLKKLEQPQRGKFQLIDGEFTLEAYRINQGFKEDRGIDKIENEFKVAKPLEASKSKRKKQATEEE
jgi:Tfp pilus assembly protein PilO